MKHAIEAALRFPTSGAPRTFFAATLAALSVTVAVFERASAQTAFTLPAPPFELPLLPPVSGNWHEMIGSKGEYRPDFKGANHSLFPARSRSSRSGAPVRWISFAARATTQDRTDRFRRSARGLRASSCRRERQAAIPSSTVSAMLRARSSSAASSNFFSVDWFRVRNETRKGFGGHQGVVSDFSADFIVPVTRAITVSAGPRFTWESTKGGLALFQRRRRSSDGDGASGVRRQGRCTLGRRGRTGEVSDQSAMGGALLRRIRSAAGRRGKKPAR